MRWLLGALISVVLVAGVTAAVAERLGVGGDEATAATTTTSAAASSTSTPPGDGLVPGPGQAFVRGTVTALSADGAVLPAVRVPIIVTTPERGFGSGATIEGVVVDGKQATIVWDAGTPLVLQPASGSADGTLALVLAPVHIDVSAASTVLLLDGPLHRFAPGTYRIDTPVAVGTGGLAAPADTVTFTADSHSTISFSGNATLSMPPAAMTLQGPGAVTITGSLDVQTAEAAVHTTTVTFNPQGGGAFDVTLTPTTGGYLIAATLQGPVTTA